MGTAERRLSHPRSSAERRAPSGRSAPLSPKIQAFVGHTPFICADTPPPASECLIFGGLGSSQVIVVCSSTGRDVGPTPRIGTFSESRLGVSLHDVRMRRFTTAPPALRVLTTRQLNARGFSSHALTRLVRSGRLSRIMNGWYALEGASPELVMAIRVGGRLAGSSAARAYGLATPHKNVLHVEVPHNAGRLRLLDDVEYVVHHVCAIEGDHPIVPLMTALEQVLRWESEDDAVACLDSALHTRQVTRPQLRALRAAVPERVRAVVDLADGRSEGYPESLLRCRLHRAGIDLQIQVDVLGERRIDGVIGDRLAIEVDGMEKYLNAGDPEAVRRAILDDRERDAFLEALGYHVIRLTYWMIVFDWPATLALIQTLIERGDHLARPKIRRS